jgi:chromosome segregation ATPase
MKVELGRHLPGMAGSTIRDVVSGVQAQVHEHDVLIDSHRRALAGLEEEAVRPRTETRRAKRIRSRLPRVQETMRTVLHNQDATLQAKLTGATESLRESLSTRIEQQSADVQLLRKQFSKMETQLSRVMTLLEKLSARMEDAEVELGLASPPGATKTLSG